MKTKSEAKIACVIVTYNRKEFLKKMFGGCRQTIV